MINIYFMDGTSKSIKSSNNTGVVPEGSWLLIKQGYKTLMAVPAENVKYVEATP